MTFHNSSSFSSSNFMPTSANNSSLIEDQFMFSSTKVESEDILFGLDIEPFPVSTGCFTTSNDCSHSKLQRRRSSLALHSLLDKFFNEETEQQHQQEQNLSREARTKTSISCFERAITPDLEEVSIPQVFMKPITDKTIPLVKSSQGLPVVVSPCQQKAPRRNEVTPLSCVSSSSYTTAITSSVTPSPITSSTTEDNKQVVLSSSRKTGRVKSVPYRLRSLKKAMLATQRTQRNLQAWDKSMGLKKCHSKTMLKSFKSRKEALVAVKEDLAFQRMPQSQDLKISSKSE